MLVGVGAVAEYQAPNVPSSDTEPSEQYMGVTDFGGEILRYYREAAQRD